MIENPCLEPHQCFGMLLISISISDHKLSFPLLRWCNTLKFQTTTWNFLSTEKKILRGPGPQVSPDVVVCGWCKLTFDLDPHTCYGNSNWSSSMQISPNLHFKVILQVDLGWPLTLICDLWPHEHMKVSILYQWTKFGSNQTSTFQMRPFLHFQPILQLDLRWPSTLVHDLWLHEHMKVYILYQ